MCLATTEAANFGTLLQGISMTAALIWGFYEVRRRREEKQTEKKSNIAEKALNELDLFDAEFKKWINETPATQQNLHNMTQWITYQNKGEEIIKNLIPIKNTTARLNDHKLDSKLAQFYEMARQLPLYANETDLYKAKSAIQPHDTEIRSILRNYLLYQQSKPELVKK